jgi:prefoldin subunit 5
MDTGETPADLNARVAALLDQLKATRRQLSDIKHEYERLDESRLAVDELGDATNPADALEASRAALVDVDRSLGLSVDAIYTAMQHTSRLYEV